MPPQVWYPKTGTDRTFPMWDDRINATFRYSGVEKARAFRPAPLSPIVTGVSTFAATTATAGVGGIIVPCPIELVSFTYNQTVAGSANAVMRYSLYTVDGATQIFNVTDAVGDLASPVERTVTLVVPLWIPPGIYYMLFCLSSGTTAPTINTYTTNALFVAGGAGEPDLEANFDVTGGAAPATIDPTALTTPFANSTLVMRWDGAD